MTFKKIVEQTPASTEVYYGGEILPNGIVQVRKCTIEKDADGNIISKSFHRHCIEPGDDYSNEPQEVKDVCAVEHTQEKIDARIAFKAEQEVNL